MPGFVWTNWVPEWRDVDTLSGVRHMCGSVRAPGRVGPRSVRAGPAAARWVNSGCVRGGLYRERVKNEPCDAVSEK